MKTMRVNAKNGKPTSIFLLTNWDLIYCFPIFIINLLAFYIVRPLMLRSINLVGWPAIKLIGDVANASKAKVWFFTVLYMLMLPSAYLYTELVDGGWIANAVWTAALLTVGLAVGEILCFANNIQAAPPLGECLTRDVFAEESRAIPEYLVDHKFSRGALVASLFLTIHIVYSVFFLTMFMNSGYLYFAPLIVLLQVMLFTDKEHIEHMSSHANGRVTRIENAVTLQDRMYCGLNWLRTYVAWPLQMWNPNYYFATHTGIHHVEDNGPADFQSTLRFDQTSFIDFVKAVTWYSLFINLFPIEVISYFRSLKRKKFLNIFLRGYAWGMSLFVLAAWLHPLLGLTLLGVQISSGINSYFFVMRWHGFHDATRPYSCEASNNSPLHYGHHKEMNVHLMIVTECCRVFWHQREKEPKSFPIFVNSDALTIYARNAMLVFFMLWQGKLDIIRKFIYTDAAGRNELKKYVTGLRYQGKRGFVKWIDEKLSKSLGAFGEKMHRRSMREADRHFFDDTAPQVMMNIRVTNFRKLAQRNNDQVMPQGVY